MATPVVGAMPVSYLYIIGEEDAQSIKIGISDSPDMRLYCLQPGNPRKLYIYGLFGFADRGSARRLEQSLHEFFGDARIGREWFRLAPYEVYDAIESGYICPSSV